MAVLYSEFNSTEANKLDQDQRARREQGESVLPLVPSAYPSRAARGHALGTSGSTPTHAPVLIMDDLLVQFLRPTWKFQPGTTIRYGIRYGT